MFSRSELTISGYYIDYQSMGKPSKDLQKISMALYDGVVVQAKDGSYYLGNPDICLSNNTDTCWHPFLETVQDGYVERYNHSCAIEHRVKPLPDYVVQSMDFSQCDPSIRYDRFILVPDGTIWVWHNEQPDLAPIAPGLAGIFGLAIGFFVGLFLVILYKTIIWLRTTYFLGENTNG